MSKFRFNLCLRIRHASDSGDSIVARMGLKADVVKNVGERRAMPNGTPLEGLHDRSYVSFPLVKNSCEWLDVVIREWCKNLESSRPVLLELRQTGGDCVLHCGGFIGESGGFELDSSLIDRMQALGLGFTASFYSSESGR